MSRVFQRLRGLLPNFRPHPSDAAPHRAIKTGAEVRRAEDDGSDPFCRVGPDGRISHVFPGAQDLFGRKPEALLGHRPESFFSAGDYPPHDNTPGAIVRIVRPDGRITWAEAARLDSHAGEIIVRVRAISDRAGLQRRLAAPAPTDSAADHRAFDEAFATLTDGVTGLANRRAFDDALDLEWRRARRLGAPVSLLLLEIDALATFRATLGPRAGDDCLRAIAIVLHGAGLRTNSVASRCAGDKLALILPDTPLGAATAVAETIRASVAAQRWPYIGNPSGGDRVTVSLGAATADFRMNGSTAKPSALLAAAELVLEKSMIGGRNHVAPAEANWPERQRSPRK